MESASVFKSNTSQVVRLPELVAFPESVKRVNIISLGRARLIVPEGEGEGWDSWFEGEGATNDFMIQRNQPDDRERESL